tara:strand:+ start:2061 stop:2570 length:510 start_codon:yes stop_codon:yes gene_type:complete
MEEMAMAKYSTAVNRSPDGVRLKAAISVSDMARSLNMSRARFYELIEAGVMPPPCYVIRTKKPFYPAEMQAICLRVREMGEGINGEPVVFYAARGKSVPKRVAKPKKASRAKRDPVLEPLIEGLRQLGLNDPDPVKVKEAVRHLYPSGLATESQSELLTAVFRRLKRRN